MENVQTPLTEVTQLNIQYVANVWSHRIPKLATCFNCFHEVIADQLIYMHISISVFSLVDFIQELIFTYTREICSLTLLYTWS